MPGELLLGLGIVIKNNSSAGSEQTLRDGVCIPLVFWPFFILQQ